MSVFEIFDMLLQSNKFSHIFIYKYDKKNEAIFKAKFSY